MSTMLTRNVVGARARAAGERAAQAAVVCSADHPVLCTLGARTRRTRRSEVSFGSVSGRSRALVCRSVAEIAVQSPPAAAPLGEANSATRQLHPDGRAFSEIFPVRCYEVGPDSRASIITVANLLQECAANHAQALWGQGQWAPKQMLDNDLAFAMSKMYIRLNSLPCWGEKVKVTTWFQEAGAISARRDWTVENAATGEVIGAGTSTWLAFNLKTRRMAKLPKDLLFYFKTSSPDPPRFAVGEGFSPEKIGELDPAKPLAAESVTTVRLADMDMNLHVNNVAYLKWVCEDVPQGVFDSHVLTSIDLEYRAEGHFGDQVASRSVEVAPAAPGARTFEHSLLRASDKAELLRARTTWASQDEVKPCTVELA